MTDIAIENPVGVINALQKQVEQLEAKLAATEDLLRHENSKTPDYSNALRRMRLFSVMPLYVGEGGLEELTNLVGKHSPELVSCVDDIWPLESAPFSDAVKQEIFAHAKNGMERW